jgi:ADP-heptose:LPS heptosyltransferase
LVSRIEICKQFLEKAKPFPEDFRTRRYETLLFVSADNIGDCVLRSFMLEYIKKNLNIGKIIVFCQKKCIDIFKENYFVDEIVTYDRKRKLINDIEYGQQLIKKVQLLHPDLVVNPVPMRNSVDDVIALANNSAIVLGYGSVYRENSRKTKQIEEIFYSRIAPFPKNDISIIEQNKIFLSYFLPNIDIISKPYIHISKRDISWAQKFFKSHSIDPHRSIVAFSGVAASKHKEYFKFGKALDLSFRGSEDITVIIIGGSDDIIINNDNFNNLSMKKYDLTGQLSLAQSAALISMVKLVFGADCGLIHIACALHTPNVTLLGNAALGLSLPYSSLTTAIIIPLDCPTCHWKCKYHEAFCVARISHESLAAALRETWDNQTDKIKVYFQSKKYCDGSSGTLELRWDWRVAETKLTNTITGLRKEFEIISLA